ncbi:hypothetical protein M0R72_12495 [Candidatus Pacearchaeota archaeon]|jgi:hypothetical protein|nr:hypothetical protein [Candidatus Pacearchaeota archaeon]
MAVKKVLLSFSEEDHKKLWNMKHEKGQTWEAFILALAGIEGGDCERCPT